MKTFIAKFVMVETFDLETFSLCHVELRFDDDELHILDLETQSIMKILFKEEVMYIWMIEFDETQKMYVKPRKQVLEQRSTKRNNPTPQWERDEP